MRSFGQYNPRAVAIWLLGCAAIAMLCPNPIIILLSLGGAAALRIARRDRETLGSLLFYLGLAVITPLFNLIFSRSGATVLLVVNHHPVTLEALLCGLGSAVMLLAVLLWMRTFSVIMTTDRMMYLLGGLWPGLALLLSLTLRFIPLFGRQAQRINSTQRALGMYKDDNIVDSVKGGGRVFSILTTWALENGIITADSMRARGYGTGRRTAYTLYRFRMQDGVLTAAAAVLLGVCIAALLSGALDFEYYPRMQSIPASPMAIAAYGAYGLMVFIPTIIETEAKLRWHSLRSGI